MRYTLYMWDKKTGEKSTLAGYDINYLKETVANYEDDCCDWIITDSLGHPIDRMVH